MTQISTLKVLCTEENMQIQLFLWFIFFVTLHSWGILFLLLSKASVSNRFILYVQHILLAGCWGVGVTTWLPFSPAESVFDNAIILTTFALYLCQEQAVLEKTPRFRKETHWQWYYDTAQGRVLFELLCLCMKSYAVKSHVYYIIIGNVVVLIPSQLAKSASAVLYMETHCRTPCCFLA